MDLATQLCSLMGLLGLVRTLIPSRLSALIDRWFDNLCDWLFKTSNPFTYLEVHENLCHKGFKENVFYSQVSLYLGSLEKTLATQRVNVFRFDDKCGFTFSLPANETIQDSFHDAKLWWTHKSSKPKGSLEKRRSFSLKMFKSDRVRLLSKYFDHISKTALEIQHLNAQRHLYTNKRSRWKKVPFRHPSSFDTLALEPEVKDRIKADLTAFSHGENFYHRVGRAWKRGYFLYGPPGTGKSSMIAAMANFLQYDIYDLELTKVYDNSSLRSLLTHTKRKSLIVIEDIDCSLDLTDRSPKKGPKSGLPSKSRCPKSELPSKGSKDDSMQVTLSGLLNFTDGLWSCCGEERIFVFTTNHKDRLDPALLRSGRMDFHILLSYCTFPSFKILASSYLGIQDHELYANLEEAMKSKTKTTPAEIAELLMGNKDRPEVALKSVMAALDEAKAENGWEATEEDTSELEEEEEEEEGSLMKGMKQLVTVK